MQGGDISNSAPLSVMVCIDLLLETTSTSVTRGHWPFRSAEMVDAKVINLSMANLFFRKATALNNVTFECFSIDGSPLDSWEQELDRLTLNPFRYWTSYGRVADLVRELNYRPTVVGVCDLPERGLRYGSHYLSLDRITSV